MNHDSDLNAANNILAAGLAISVCGATVRPEQLKSVKRRIDLEETSKSMRQDGLVL
jgi:hypothetical protein